MRKALFIALGLVGIGGAASADGGRVALTMTRPRVVTADFVPAGRYPMAFRAAANRYAVVGEGTVRTKDCTWTSPGQEIVLSARDSRGRRWVTFVDRNGEIEADCEVDDGPVRAPIPQAKVVIRRGVATTDGK